MNLHLRGLEPTEFPDQLYELLHACFKGSDESKIFQRLHFERPYDIPSWEYSRVGTLDGNLVSHAGIWKFDLQLTPGIVLKSGGIRDVCTDPEQQKKGYGHQVLQDACKFMEQEELQFSVLYAGPKKFYRALGWYDGLPSYAVEIDAETFSQNIKELNIDVNLSIKQLESYDDKIADKLRDIRKKTNYDLNFIVIRDKDYFSRLLKVSSAVPEGKSRNFMITDTDTSDIIGYVLTKIAGGPEGRHLQITEARFLSDDQSAVCSKTLELLFKTNDISKISISLSPSHPITATALSLGAKDSTGLISGIMVKFISLPGDRKSTRLNSSHYS